MWTILNEKLLLLFWKTKQIIKIVFFCIQAVQAMVDKYFYSAFTIFTTLKRVFCESSIQVIWNWKIDNYHNRKILLLDNYNLLLKEKWAVGKFLKLFWFFWPLPYRGKKLRFILVGEHFDGGKIYSPCETSHFSTTKISILVAIPD